MSIIKNNKTYGVETKKMPANNQNKSINANGEYTADDGYDGLGTVTVNVSSVVWPDYLTVYYSVPEPSNSFQILGNTDNISGYRVKGASTWETPTTTITVSDPCPKTLVLEFNLTDNTKLVNNQFSSCYNLFKIDFPVTLTTLEQGCLYNCRSLCEAPNMENITTVEGDVFYSINIKSGTYVINDNKTRDWVGMSSWTCSNYMWVNGRLLHLYDGSLENAVSVDNKSFDFTNGIEGLQITEFFAPFWNINITEIKFPSTLTRTAAYNFSGTTIGNVYFYGTTPPTTSEATIFVNGSITGNIYVPASALTDYQNSNYFSDVVSKITAMP